MREKAFFDKTVGEAREKFSFLSTFFKNEIKSFEHGEKKMRFSKFIKNSQVLEENYDEFL